MSFTESLLSREGDAEEPGPKAGLFGSSLIIRFFGLAYDTVALQPVVLVSLSKFVHEAPAAGMVEPDAMSTSLL
jgi:hypothetical protein